MTTHQDPANEKEISYKLTDELTIDMKDFSWKYSVSFSLSLITFRLSIQQVKNKLAIKERMTKVNTELTWCVFSPNTQSEIINGI